MNSRFMLEDRRIMAATSVKLSASAAAWWISFFVAEIRHPPLAGETGKCSGVNSPKNASILQERPIRSGTSCDSRRKRVGHDRTMPSCRQGYVRATNWK